MISHRVISWLYWQAYCPVVIATRPGLQVFWVFTATFTLVEPAAIISAWVVGAPSEFSLPTLHHELQKKKLLQ